MSTFLSIQNDFGKVQTVDEAKALVLHMLQNNVTYNKEVKRKMFLHVRSITSLKYFRTYYAKVLLCMHNPGKSPMYKIYDTEEFFQAREDTHIETLNRPQIMPFGGHSWLNTTLKKDRKIEI